MSGPDHSMDSHDECDRGLHPGMMVQQDFVGMMPGVSNRLGEDAVGIDAGICFEIACSL